MKNWPISAASTRAITGPVEQRGHGSSASAGKEKSAEPTRAREGGAQPFRSQKDTPGDMQLAGDPKPLQVEGIDALNATSRGSPDIVVPIRLVTYAYPIPACGSAKPKAPPAPGAPNAPG